MEEEARYHGYSQVHFENAVALRVHTIAHHRFRSRHGNVATPEGNYGNIAPHHSCEIGDSPFWQRIRFATPHGCFNPRTP
jgi:hypothetical protein